MSLLPLLDSFTLKRPVAAADSEGNPTSGYTTVASYSGTYGTANHHESIVAGQRNETIDAWLSMHFADVRPGDRVVGLRGRDWEVVGLKDLRIHQRVALRSIG